MLKKAFRLPFSLLAIFLLLGITACSNSKPTSFTIVVSTSSWASLVKEIVQDKAQIKIIINDSKRNPHDYQASAADIATIRSANLAIYNGGNYDKFFGQALKNTHTTSIMALQQLPPEILNAPHAKDNEHAFYSLTTAQNMATQVYNQLVKLDSPNKTSYQKNWETLNEKLLSLIHTTQIIKKQFTGINYVQDELLAGFLLYECGFHDVTPPHYLANSIKEVSPSLQDLMDLQNSINRSKIQLVVLNKSTQTELTNKLISKAKAERVPYLSFSETLPQGITTYTAWQSANLTDIKTALQTGTEAA